MRKPVRRARVESHAPTIEEAYPSVGVLSSTFWHLTHLLGDLGLVLLLLGTVLLALGGHLQIARTLAPIVPAAFRDYFRPEPEPSDRAWAAGKSNAPSVLDRIVAKSDTARASSGTDPAAASFGIGATKEEVRAIQGEPTEASGNVWRYGKSEVYFAQGRVVSWYSAKGHPLRARSM